MAAIKADDKIRSQFFGRLNSNRFWKRDFHSNDIIGPEILLQRLFTNGQTTKLLIDWFWHTALGLHNVLLADNTVPWFATTRYIIHLFSVFIFFFYLGHYVWNGAN